MRSRFVVISVLMFATLAATSCGGDTARDVIPVDALETCPFEKIDDWRSFADAVVVLTVDDEKVTWSGRAGIGASSERSVGTVVDRVIWSGAGQPPKTMWFTTYGSTMAKRGEVLERPEGGLRPEVGRQYLAGIVYARGEEPGLLTGSSAIEVQDGVLRSAPDAPAVTRGLDGQRVETFVERFEKVEPDPLAAKLADLPTSERCGRVQAMLDQAPG